jgi:hypothetical protein
VSQQGFAEVLDWLAEERGYQTTKFNYEKEKERPVEYWLQQFASYEQRLPLFGLDNASGIQAALKLAATAVALCEHLADQYELPAAGLPSGYFQ